MDPEDIKLDRYAKFRKIGQYEEYLVRGGKWKEAQKLRKEVRCCPLYSVGLSKYLNPLLEGAGSLIKKQLENLIYSLPAMKTGSRM